MNTKIMTSVLVATLAMSVQTAWAQRTEPPPPGAIPPALKQQTTVVPQRLSLFLDREVITTPGEKKVGRIVDIVLDGTVNRVNYVVIAYVSPTDAATAPEKLLALPWGLFEYRQAEPKKVYVKLDDELLSKAPGFTKNQWPDLSQSAYRRELATYYHVTIADEPVASTPATTAPATQSYWNRRVSEIIGATVKNNAKEVIGEVRELIVDTSAVQVQYAVLSFSSNDGKGDKLFAVPLSAFQAQNRGKDLILDIPRERFKNAPGFDKNSWPDWTSVDFRASMEQLTRPTVAP